MAAIVASGPIRVNLDDQFFLLPLSFLDLTDQGEVVATRWPEYSGLNGDQQSAVKARLKALSDSGVLRRAEQLPARPAIVLRAADPGAAGNGIKVDFTNVKATSTPPTVDATVTETDTHKGLTPKTIEAVLGTTAGGGTSPGLVYVANNVGKMPSDAQKYPLAGSTKTAPAKADVKADDGSTAFTVKAAKPDVGGEAITVEIKDVDAAAKTFTLVATWTKTKAGLKVDKVDAFNTEFDYLVTAANPQGATTPLPPAEGATFLHGGAAAQPALPANATILATA